MLRFKNLIEALDAAPPECPFITSWIDEDERETVTFAEFRQRARTEATALRSRGLTAGDRVVIIMPQGIAAMTSFVAAMMLGAVPAFLAYPNFKIEPSKYRSGLAGVTANLNASAVLIDDEFPEDLLECVAVGAETELIRCARNHSPIEATTHLRTSPIAPDSIAFIQHSAGTTGLQKGVALTHSAVLRQIEYLSQALKIDSNSDRIYSWLPLYHDMGLIACFMLPMVCHVPIVLQSPLDWVMHPETLLQIMAECRCTLAWMPNFAFQFVPRRTPPPRWAEYDLSSLRCLINCSEPVRASSMREFQKAFRVRDAVLQTSYAMAENVFAVTQSDVDRDPAALWADGPQFRNSHRVVRVAPETPGAILFTSSGRVLPNQRVRIVSDRGDALADDAVGEIEIQGDCLFQGYYNRPDLTAQAMAGGWHHTGDLGFCHKDELFVIGRKKDLIIVGGENIYPQDIEEIVSANPVVHDGRAIALGLYNPDLGTEDIVVVAELNSEDLLAHAGALESEIRGQIVAALGIAVRTIFLKPPKWIVKSTAGKQARSASREKLLREHPEFNVEP